MNHQVSRPRIAQSAAVIAGSLLWGLFEVIALARSRWMRRREQRGRPATDHRVWR